MENIFKPVTGYNGLYEVSNQGVVRSLDKDITAKNRKVYTRKGRVLKGSMTGPGTMYLKVRLTDHNGVSRLLSVHRLVAEAFVDNPHGHRIVCHCDGNSANNVASNLRWDTQAENVRDMYRHGRKTVGYRHLTKNQTREIQESKLTLNELAAIYKVHPVTISKHRHKPI